MLRSLQESKLLSQPSELCILRDVAAKEESNSVVLFSQLPLVKVSLEMTRCCCEEACSGPEAQLLLKNKSRY